MGSRGSYFTNSQDNRISEDDILEEVSMMSNRNPENQKEIDEVLSVMRNIYDEYQIAAGDLVIATMKKSKDSVAGYHKPSDGTIGINKTYLDSESCTKAYDASIKKGYHPSRGNRTGLEAIAAHEIGHRIARVIAENQNIRQLSILQQAIKQTNYHSIEDMAKSISGYARKNHHETIAEAFTDVYCNGNNASAASIAIVNTLKKLNQ